MIIRLLNDNMLALNTLHYHLNMPLFVMQQTVIIRNKLVFGIERKLSDHFYSSFSLCLADVCCVRTL